MDAVAAGGPWPGKNRFRCYNELFQKTIYFYIH
jgi:hypothetical protein